jgi:hypothetical protein
MGSHGPPEILEVGSVPRTVKKKINFINLPVSQNEGLSPSCIALSFDGFGSIS